MSLLDHPLHLLQLFRMAPAVSRVSTAHKTTASPIRTNSNRNDGTYSSSSHPSIISHRYSPSLDPRIFVWMFMMVSPETQPLNMTCQRWAKERKKKRKRERRNGLPVPPLPAAMVLNGDPGSKPQLALGDLADRPVLALPAGFATRAVVVGDFWRGPRAVQVSSFSERRDKKKVPMSTAVVCSIDRIPGRFEGGRTGQVILNGTNGDEER